MSTQEINDDTMATDLIDVATPNYTPMSSPGLVAIVNPADWKIHFVNPAFEHYLGYDSSDIKSGSILFTDLLEEYQHDRLQNQLSNVNDNAAARNHYLMYPLRSKSGRLSNYYLYASPVVERLNGTEQLFYFLLFPDLSRWGMPFTSFDSKELFLEQFDSEDFGTFERNFSTDKVFWSAGLYRIFEVDEHLKEIDTRYSLSFIHPEDLERIKESARSAAHIGADLNVEFRIITSTQKLKIIHCLARLVKDIHGNPRLFTGSLRDVTEQRQIEADLKNKVEELNHSNRELEEFAYVASHDMQEPLRKITTFSDRLSEKYKDVLSGDGLMYLSRMTTSAENMRNLINDLLEFSRIAKTEQPFEQVDLSQVLQQVLSDLELVIEETETVVNADTLPVLDAVPSQMKQLFTNIINNAIKFHKEDVSPVIRIKSSIAGAREIPAGEQDKGQTWYKIEISDNGIGFEDEYAIRIFQVFQRLHGKSEYPGTGIGLAICKKILEFHKGYIYAENVPDTGARFTFVMPGQQQTDLNS